MNKTQSGALKPIFSKPKTEIPKSQILNQVQDLVRDDRGTRTKSSCHAELGSASKGFTLIEIVIVIVILSIISAISIKFIVDSLRIYTMTVNQKTLFDEAKLALERMCRDIRDAKSITTPLTGGSANTITVLRSNATAQDIVDESITFALNGTTLEKVKASVGYAIALNVSTFMVTRGQAGTNDENQITIQLTLTSGSAGSVNLQTRVYPKDLLEDVQATYKNFFYCWEEVRS